MQSARSKSAAKPSKRLEAGDWVNAALAALADFGIGGVRVEKLALTLGVTKGSFYWHFKDRDALLLELLETWRRRATVQVMERLERRAMSAQQRLEELLRFPFASPRAAEGSDVELAIRLWGRNDPRAWRILAEIDELRLRYLTSILTELGLPTEEAEARAVIGYGFMRVGNSLPLTGSVDALIKTVASIIGAAQA
ncbi:TetR/AcrR family transcriptional regulator [Aquisediminimonas profunda]|uniref:TetR/AcrR family transcriptional regulator n=1 Tax=Aquisediminimonas profunda TaxID=1550733 RepID=UPI001C62A668|nr:TetR/AcrR family transcriptional regulator [Aquisediminimonas profunda]